MWWRRKRPSPEDLILVTLSQDQIAKAKAENGERKKITHALLCGKYGQRFDTEKQCRKYFDAWTTIFVPSLFPRAIITGQHQIRNFKTTFNLVNLLLDASDHGRQG